MRDAVAKAFKSSRSAARSDGRSIGTSDGTSDRASNLASNRSARMSTARPTVATTLVMLASLVAAWLMTGCVSSAGIAPKAAPLEAQAFGARGTPAPVAGDWWTAFGDPQLDALVQRALADSPDLKRAQARIARAQANAGIAESALSPQLGAGVDLSRQRYSANGLYPPPLAGATLNSGNLQLNGSWELDLFGRNRAQLEAAVGAAHAAEADAQAARVLLAANVVRSYVQLGRLIEQKAVSERILAQRGDTLKLVQQRVGAGLDTRVEERQSAGLLPDTRQTIEQFDEQITLARHALAVLTVQAPDALDALTPSLSPVHVTALPQVVPADLLARRADVVAARWRIEAAAKNVDLARAEFYPSINLMAFAGLNAIGLDRLFKADSRQLGIGPALRLPIFEAGELRANLRGATADVDTAVESYNATVLDAVREVADQIASVQSVERQARQQAEAQAAAESGYDLALQRYRAGLATYLTVLNAETTVLAQRRAATDLKARAIDTQIVLVRALGGGWQPDSVLAPTPQL